MSDNYTTIAQVSDLLDEKNRDHLLEVLGTAADATDDFLSEARVMTDSAQAFAQPCLDLYPSRFTLGDYSELCALPSPPSRKLVILKGFENIAACEIASLFLEDESSTFTALLDVGLTTRAIADLGEDEDRLFVFDQNIEALLRGLANQNRSEH